MFWVKRFNVQITTDLYKSLPYRLKFTCVQIGAKKQTQFRRIFSTPPCSSFLWPLASWDVGLHLPQELLLLHAIHPALLASEWQSRGRIFLWVCRFEFVRRLLPASQMLTTAMLQILPTLHSSSSSSRTSLQHLEVSCMKLSRVPWTNMARLKTPRR